MPEIFRATLGEVRLRSPRQDDEAGQRLIRSAKALLEARHGMDEAGAHRLLQKESMNLRKPMWQVAEALLLAERLKKKLPPD